MSTLYAQEWASVGTRWYYNQGFAFSSDKGYYLLEAEKDTVVNQQPCVKILGAGSMCMQQPAVQMIYEEDSIVYYYERTSEQFQVLYNFNDDVSSWKVWVKGVENDTDTIQITVNSTETFEYEQRSFKKLEVTYTYLEDGEPTELFYNSTITTYMGDEKFFFNLRPRSYFACDMDFSMGLRCYDEPAFSTYSTNEEIACTYVGTSQVDRNKAINVYPNPVTDYLYLSTEDVGFVSLSVKDATGHTVIQRRAMTNVIDLQSLNPGIYYLTLRDQDGQVVTKKIAKQ